MAKATRQGTSKSKRNGSGAARAKSASVSGFNSEALFASVGNGRSSADYKPKAVIFPQGDPADAVYYIDSGRVQLRVVSQQGKERVIAMLGPGEFFGEGCLAGQPKHISSAVAIGACTVTRLEKHSMIRVLHDEPKISKMFMGFLLARNIQIEADLVDQLFNSSERRLARILLLLANFGKEGKMEMVIPKISQEVLAARVGTTRARINYFMNKFRKLGFIEYNGSLKVHNGLLNVVVHD